MDEHAGLCFEVFVAMELGGNVESDGSNVNAETLDGAAHGLVGLLLD